MGVFQDIQAVIQPHIDPIVASAFNYAHGEMVSCIGTARTDEIFDAAFQPYQSAENVMEGGVDGVAHAAQWVGTQVSEVMSRLNTCEPTFPRCYAPVTIDRPRMGGGVSINFYGGNASFYPFMYQCSPMMFFTAISSCWQMGINPFLNPYMLFQMLMMLMMMQQNMIFMFPLPVSLLGIGTFIPGFSFHLNLSL